MRISKTNYKYIYSNPEFKISLMKSERPLKTQILLFFVTAACFFSPSLFFSFDKRRKSCKFSQISSLLRHIIIIHTGYNIINKKIETIESVVSWVKNANKDDEGEIILLIIWFQSFVRFSVLPLKPNRWWLEWWWWWNWNIGPSNWTMLLLVSKHQIRQHAHKLISMIIIIIIWLLILN